MGWFIVVKGWSDCVWVFGMGNLNLDIHIPFAYHEPFLCLLLLVHTDPGLEGELTEVQLVINK